MTPLELLVPALLRAELLASVALIAVGALRRPIRDLLGAELAYRLWLLPLVVALASFFPSLREFMDQDAAPRAASITGIVDWSWAQAHASLIGFAWLGGAAALSSLMLVSELRFKALVRQGRAGPAVVGIAWPQFIIPSDYRRRFSPAERALIREHERAHMERKDPRTNLFIAAMQVVGWFNPVMHWAADRARIDQELACDAMVIESHPKDRRAYGEALLKIQASSSRSPIACYWNLAAHPLELRIRMLARHRISLDRFILGTCLISALWVVAAAALWVFAPI